MTELSTLNRLRRRLFTGGAVMLAGAGLGPLSRAAFAQAATVDLPMINGRRNRVAFPEKRPLIVLTSRPPQLETPFEVFNDGIITPNDAFFVRYHNAGIPTSLEGDKHLIKVGGSACGKPSELTMAELRTGTDPARVSRWTRCGSRLAMRNVVESVKVTAV